MRYSIEPRDRIYVKRYGLLSFAKNIGKSLSNKYGQKLLNSAKTSTAHLIKTDSKRGMQKTAGETGDLIGNKIADKITSVSTELHSKNYTKILENDNTNDEIEIPKKKIHISRKTATNY